MAFSTGMKTPFSRRIGMNIAKMRNARDWSQEKLAERVDVDDSTVERWEYGSVVPCGLDVLKLAVVFGVGTDAIYDGLPRNVAALDALHSRKCEKQKALA